MSDRLRGLLRWEAYLEGRLSPHGIVREDPEKFETSDAVWQISFRGHTQARVYVTDRAVRLNEDEFEELVLQLKELDWIRMLMAVRPGGIRVHRDGGVEEMGPKRAEE